MIHYMDSPFDNVLDFNIMVTKSGIGNVESNDRRIYCLASTEDRDEQDERIIQKALNIDYLPKDGKFLWGHSPKPPEKISPKCILGPIDVAKVLPEGLYTEGVLMKSKEYADIIYNDIKNNESLTPYKASIEGSYRLIISRDGTVQKSAIVRNVAFDTNVINTNTLVGLVKSFHSGRDTCNCHKAIPRCNTNEERMRLFIMHNAICRNLDIKEIKTLIRNWVNLRG